MKTYDDEYDRSETNELEFKASLLATEFPELYDRFTQCLFTSLNLELAVEVEDIHCRASELELGIFHLRAQLIALHRKMALFNLAVNELERKQRLLRDLRREARMGNYGPTSGKQRLIREVEVQARHLAVQASEKAFCADEDYRGLVELATVTMQGKCASLIGRVDTLAYSLQGCIGAAIGSGNDRRYEQCNAVLQVLAPTKETLVYLEQKLKELQSGIKAAHARPVENMRRRAEVLLPQSVE